MPVLLAIAGATFLLSLTPWGIGISPDSIVFIDAAQNLMNGRGLTMTTGDGFAPLTHHPPFYPSALALLGVLGLHPVLGARLLSAALLAGNMILVGLLARRNALRQWLAAPVAALLYLGTFGALNQHLYAHTEAPFVFFSLLSLLLFSSHWRAPSWVKLWSSAAAAALAFLTRYIGAALVVALALAATFQKPRPWRERLAEACSVLIVGLAPMGIWMVQNVLRGGSATNRTFAFHPPSFKQLQSAAYTLLDWTLPPELFASRPELWLPLAGALVALLGLALWRQHRRSGLEMEARLALTFVACYGAVLLLSLTFFDAYTPLDGRILSPVLATGIVLIVSLVDSGIDLASGRPRRQRLLVGVCTLLVLAHSYRGISRALPVRKDGLGFAARAWGGSALVAQAAGLAEEQPIYSNGPDALLHHLGRPVHWLPMPENPSVGQPNAEYEREMELMSDRVCGQGGALVYWRLVDWRYYLPSEEYLVERLGLTPIFEDLDGAIYRCADPPARR